ncbi:MAG: hypothetical protein RLZZ08_1233 [Pseudomonadota bacterium]|jgi:protein TonB
MPVAAERRLWSGAALAALAAHGAIAALALLLVVPRPVPVPEPVVLVDLPPATEQPPVQSSAAAQPQEAQSAAPLPAQTPPQRIDAPQVRAPLPADPVVIPTASPRMSDSRPAPAPMAVPPVSQPVQPAAAPARSDNATDPRAKAREADYFAQLSAYLNRRKSYPAAARQAREQGVVTVRFTVGRNGGVSGISLRRSSGHAVLDDATLDLLQRVAPLPKMPASMQRDSITLSLPIEYSLRTD